MTLVYDEDKWERRLECKGCRVTFRVTVEPEGDVDPKGEDFIGTMTYCPRCGKPTVEDVA